MDAVQRLAESGAGRFPHFPRMPGGPSAGQTGCTLPAGSVQDH